MQIAYSLPQVMHETDQNGPMPLYGEFMQSQRMLIMSHRVVDMAVQDPVWTSTRRPVPPEPDRYFAKHVKVEVTPGSEYIAVSATDADPLIAANAVNSVVNAYSDWYREREKTGERNRIGALEDRLQDLQAQIKMARSKLDDATHVYGTTDLTPFFEQALAKVVRLETALDAARDALTVAAAATRPAVAEPAGAGDDPQRPALRAKALEQLASAARRELTDIGMERSQLRLTEQQMERLQKQSDETSYRIQCLKTEGALGGHSRLTVISTGEVALSPQRDCRIVAAAGTATGGAMLPIAVTGIWRLARRRASTSRG
ncbi:MAG: hypothetical protein JWN24_3024 [Phycisphaerales bacterium]|nr:hypothetical protein [Phycisphaerales bacterium]